MESVKFGWKFGLPTRQLCELDVFLLYKYFYIFMMGHSFSSILIPTLLTLQLFVPVTFLTVHALHILITNTSPSREIQDTEPISCLYWNLNPSIY